MIYFSSLILQKHVILQMMPRSFFFCCEKGLGFLRNRLEHDCFLAIEWFQNNYMKLYKTSVIYLLLNTSTKVSGHKLIKQKLVNLIITSYQVYKYRKFILS